MKCSSIFKSAIFAIFFLSPFLYQNCSDVGFETVHPIDKEGGPDAPVMTGIFSSAQNYVNDYWTSHLSNTNFKLMVSSAHPFVSYKVKILDENTGRQACERLVSATALTAADYELHIDDCVIQFDQAILQISGFDDQGKEYKDVDRYVNFDHYNISKLLSFKTEGTASLHPLPTKMLSIAMDKQALFNGQSFDSTTVRIYSGNNKICEHDFAGSAVRFNFSPVSSQTYCNMKAGNYRIEMESRKADEVVYFRNFEVSVDDPGVSIKKLTSLATNKTISYGGWFDLNDFSAPHGCSLKFEIDVRNLDLRAGERLSLRGLLVQYDGAVNRLIAGTASLSADLKTAYVTTSCGNGSYNQVPLAVHANLEVKDLNGNFLRSSRVREFWFNYHVDDSNRGDNPIYKLLDINQ